MAIDTRAKRQAAASVGLANPPVPYPSGAIDAEIRPQIANAYWTFSSVLDVAPYYGVQTIAAPALLDTGDPSVSTFPDYTIFIDGIDRTSYFRIQTEGQGMKIEKAVNSRSTLQLVSYDPAGTYYPQRRQTVQVYLGSSLEFNGFIERSIRERVKPKAVSGPLKTTVSCIDLGVLCDRRYVGSEYTFVNGGSFTAIVWDIVQNCLDGTGITYVPNYLNNPLIDDMLFYYVTVTEAFRRLASIANVDWYIDPAGNLRFFNAVWGGYTSAPYQITDTVGTWRNIKVTDAEDDFANEVIAKSSLNLGSVWTDSFLGMGNPDGSGLGIYIQSFPLDNEVPTVTVDGVAQRVRQFGAPGDTDTIVGAADQYDFYTLYNGWGVFRNQFLPTLSPSAVVEISYDSPLPYIGYAKDDASIAAYGRRTKIVEAGEINSKDVLQSIAENVLERTMQSPNQIEIETDLDGFEPGQLVTVNVTSPAVADDFIINAVSKQEVSVGRSGGYFRSTLKASNRDFHEIANPDRFMGELIQRSREDIKREMEHIRFVIAGTIEGFDNPGVTVGLKTPIARAPRDGVISYCSLVFESLYVRGNTTTADIIIDIYQNGVSIFESGNQLTLPAGQFEVKVNAFRVDGLQVAKNDKFTIEIIQGDAQAMDGDLDIGIL